MDRKCGYTEHTDVEHQETLADDGSISIKMPKQHDVSEQTNTRAHMPMISIHEQNDRCAIRTNEQIIRAKERE